MWICSKHGFYSVVRKEGGFHVRGRKKQDVLNAAKLIGAKANRVASSPQADYAWRIVVTADELQMLMQAFASTLDYDNFKNHILFSDDQEDKHETYGKIWHLMSDYQEETK